MFYIKVRELKKLADHWIPNTKTLQPVTAFSNHTLGEIEIRVYIANPNRSD